MSGNRLRREDEIMILIVLFILLFSCCLIAYGNSQVTGN